MAWKPALLEPFVRCPTPVHGVPLHKRLLCLAAVLFNFNRG